MVCFFIDYKGPIMIQLGHSLNIMSNDFQLCPLCFLVLVGAVTAAFALVTVVLVLLVSKIA